MGILTKQTDANDSEAFEYYTEGVKIRYKGNHTDFKWAEVTKVNVFKTDLITVDRVEMEIVCQEKVILINEDFKGWEKFILKIKEIFPVIPSRWDTEIMQPAFGENFMTIYNKRLAGI